ncbi:hypothetical protein RN001_011215 [Aquatica leii]|uniref:Uncharacterized protein n=1 Tax=Aquatica leii TaxID=1421715 RepID=A0AAN7P7R5_9COLE|nr:hypothetical protein RN001_011215 [Aquatica leii]
MTKQALVLVFAMVLAVITQILFSLILRLTKADPKDWKLGYGRISIVNITYSPNFEFFYVYQSVSVMYGMVSYVVITILITGVFDYIATQFQILQIDLSNMLYEPTFITEKKTTWNYLQNQMKDFVSYHIHVSKVVDEVTEIFSEVILCTFIGIVTVICLNVYRASMLPLQNINAFRILLEAIIGSFCTILICNAGENLTQEGQRLSEFAYDVDFVGTDLRFQTCLMIIMRKSQQPIRLKAGKLIDISLVTFAWIMRASYSLYAVLKTANSNG